MPTKPLKKCPEGKEINPKTGRCVKKCKSNRIRDIKTFKCIKDPLNHVVNPITERYVKSAYLKNIEKNNSVYYKLLEKPINHLCENHHHLKFHHINHHRKKHQFLIHHRAVYLPQHQYVNHYHHLNYHYQKVQIKKQYS